MRFTLIKSLSEIVDYYDDIPEIGSAPSSAYENYKWDLADQSLLAEDFMDPINDLCGTVLDIYDVDYFDTEQSRMLKSWLEERLKQPCDERLRELYTVLLDYATRAVELGTGVVVEL